MTAVTMVRVYCSEAENLLNKVIDYLHNKANVKGVTVFRGIAGFGKSTKMHTARLVDLSPDLPLVIEFFDAPDKVAAIIEHLKTMIEADHIVHWAAAV